MSDDIVTRLREQATAEKPLFPRSYLMEAAEEIELLRKDVEFWEKRYWQLVAEVTP